MSASDLSGRLLVPVIARPRRPLSSSASTASCSMRFSLRTMMSGALSSRSRRRRLLRLMTRRYRSFKSEVAKRPPSSGTKGRRSGGNTGNTVSTIHSGLLPDSMKASMSFRRLDSRLILVSEFVFAMSSRTFTTSDGRSMDFRSSWTASAPMRASNSSPCSSMDSRYISSVSNCPRCSEVMPGSTTTKASKYSTRSISQGHVEHETDARRQRLQEPDVRGGARQLDMAHALAAHLGLSHFDAALLAHHAAMLQALVLAAQALVVLHRPED